MQLRSTVTGKDMFKHMSEELLFAIVGIFNDIWHSGNYPVAKKTRLIVALLKSRKNKETTNACVSISLTS